MKIQIGDMNEEKYFTAFEEADIYVSDWVKDLISKIEFQKEKETLDVEIVTMGELGFPEGASRKDIYERAKEKGYGLLPAEVALAFRLAYKESKPYQWNLIGIEPISGSDGGQNAVGVVRYGDGQWLSAHDGSATCFWDAEYRWVFSKKKQYPPALTTPDGVAQKVLGLVNADEEDSCWLWQGATSKGYGQVKFQGKQYSAHRVMFEGLVGKIPEGLVLDHLCDAEACVNPNHMAIVTQKENVQRSWAKGRKPWNKK